MNMRKKVLSAAIIAAAGVGSAQAVHVSQNGTGQVLLFPYYTVNADNKTLVSVVNTTSDFKAVKVRFREGRNSREVLDFNLYLSPYDVWVGSIQDDGNGGAMIRQGAKETSCTAPAIPADGQEFLDYAYAGGALTGLDADGGPTDRSRMREGYVEILEMGIAVPVPDSTDADYAALYYEWSKTWDNDKSLANSVSNGINDVEHVDKDGEMVPDYCQGIRDNFTMNNGVWNDDLEDVVDYGLLPPTGGLTGSATIINVESGSQIDVPATILDNVFKKVVHYNPGTLLPGLDEAGEALVEGQAGAASRSNLFYQENEYPVIHRSDWSGHPDAADWGDNKYNIGPQPEPGAFAVAAVLQAQSIMNEYTVNPDTNAETSWVVTFPMRWAFVDEKTDGYGSSDAISPFTNGAVNGLGSEAFTMTIWDRDEADMSPEPSQLDFSPLPAMDIEEMALPYEVNVINFGESDVFASELSVKVTLEDTYGSGNVFDSGWAQMDFVDGPGETRWGHALMDYAKASEGHLAGYFGLPVIGFRASLLRNPQAGAQYGAGTTHTFKRLYAAFEVESRVYTNDDGMFDVNGNRIYDDNSTTSGYCYTNVSDRDCVASRAVPEEALVFPLETIDKWGTTTYDSGLTIGDDNETLMVISGM